jgi:translation initiation factor 2 subunit 2
MLDRVFRLLREKNPLLSERKRHVMPPPQMVRIGSRKTMWANISQMCDMLSRSMDHVIMFLMSELGTEGSVDGNQRLVIKGRYMPKQIESLLKKYIIEYVTCSMCKNPDTTLTRDSMTRLYFIKCEMCASTRSVAPIKVGFKATLRADRRAAKK